MTPRYPYNDRKETDNDRDAILYLHRCDYAACRDPATQFFKADTRLCGKHGEQYARSLPRW